MFSEVNILGVYVAPFAVMLLAASVAMVPLRMIGERVGLARRVWHAGLFELSVYVIVLSLIVLGCGALP
ncbi:DUF1656 domain-containing protein [Ancylobacter lacus]|uniref:DUF1656 domain-containing protein n=1 Tax=Ancylobacter lacus TaxID=2579970 RepID=UPI001BCCD592|nr:DUF1656 domain-containing protein [Ancylobacter lacus]MBS7538170.1 DUF1656 domain-containing protein [Ancylobacter lacus]